MATAKAITKRHKAKAEICERLDQMIGEANHRPGNVDVTLLSVIRKGSYSSWQRWDYYEYTLLCERKDRSETITVLDDNATGAMATAAWLFDKHEKEERQC